MASLGVGVLSSLPRIRNVKSKRVSSWDRTGANDDRLHINPGEKRVIADINGSGCITHIWMTMDCKEKFFLRKAVLRIFWDGEENPSVETPIGDFFGAGHAIPKNFTSLPLTMSPEDGKAFNCFFPMPFSEKARIEIENECKNAELILYYYIDYEAYKEMVEELGRFHAQWRRENPCDGIMERGMCNEEFQGCGKFFSAAKNLTGKGNYVILDAQGKGQYVGCILSIHNLRETREDNWYGEGDDMIFIDGEKWPPSLHGTGTEDYFNTAWCPTQEFSAPLHGIIMAGGPNWSGRVTLYRFHIVDPIHFSKSVKVTIEHGHANRRSDDYSSIAYWYQLEPHKKFPPLLFIKERTP